MNYNKVPLIPRKKLFSNPDRLSVTISPDGSQLMWLAPLDGVQNIWIAPRNNPEAASAITQDTERGIHSCFWTYNSNYILSLQDNSGDENWHLHAVELQTGIANDLTPFEGAKVQFYTRRPKYPNDVIVGINHRKPQWHDIYRINIVTGELTLLLEHERFTSVVVDNDLQIRFGIQMTKDGGEAIYRLVNGDWQFWDEVQAEDIFTTGMAGFDVSNEKLYVLDSRGRNTSALVSISLDSKETRILAKDPKVDVSQVLVHPTERHIQAVLFVFERKRWQILDPSIEYDFDYLQAVCDGDISITSRSQDDSFWIAAYTIDDAPLRFYLYDRNKTTATFLFTVRKELENLSLAKMQSIVFNARDGLELLGYYSLPPGSDSNNNGIPDQSLPMVFTPHGGPWSRSYWGYSWWHQWLANRGYVVLTVNFRASTGFGKTFINAGDLEWGGKIIEDQQDAVYWAIEAGIADPSRMAVMGISFGGYSALAGLTFTPELFACGVDLVGPANLVTFMQTLPPYWEPMRKLFTERIGDPDSKEGRALLEKHSPINYVDQISKPLLVGQGANDPRVKQAESDQIVQAVEQKGIPVTYALYPDEGHGFVRPENNLSFYSMAEAFLAEHIGGRCEPIGDDFVGSNAEILSGVDQIQGLQEVLIARKKK